jgi:hypothetical protein
MGLRRLIGWTVASQAGGLGDLSELRSVELARAKVLRAMR